ncbi:MAG: hypothetical protein AB8C46_04900 [Burkholderiaceae bacterium]
MNHRLVFKRLIDRYQVGRFILASAIFVALAGCVGAPKLSEAPVTISPNRINDEKTAQEAWKASQVAKYGEIWTRESRPDGDPYLAGQAAYYLALATFEPEWSKVAISSFEQALKSELASPDRARAGLGGANRLAARDFPVRGVAQFLLFGTGVAIRSNYVRTAVSNLNRAVDSSPDDPLVRLPRAVSFVGIPTFFSVRQDGLADFEVLERWTQQPESNSEFFDLLSSQEWRDEYYLMRAQSMAQAGNEREAKKAWRILSTEAIDPYLQALASYRLEQSE